MREGSASIHGEYMGNPFVSMEEPHMYCSGSRRDGPWLDHSVPRDGVMHACMHHSTHDPVMPGMTSYGQTLAGILTKPLKPRLIQSMFSLALARAGQAPGPGLGQDILRADAQSISCPITGNTLTRLVITVSAQ